MRRRWLIPLAVIAVGALGALLLRPGGGGRPSLAARGEQLFRTEFTPEQGLGPLFNEPSCATCHSEPVVGGVGPKGLATVLRVGRLTEAGFDPLVGRGGPIAQAHAISELGAACARAGGIPAGANLTSVRNTPALFGAGLIDSIPEATIRAGAASGGGRPNLVRGPDGSVRVGRFGWKAEIPTLELMVAEALRSELGVTSPLAPGGPLPAGTERCTGEADVELDAEAVRALTAYVAALPARLPRGGHPSGERVFRQAGCTACHVPKLGRAPLYSDLLLHDMGRELDDRVVQGSAGGRDWRTAPLWGLSARRRYLHDGRADSLEAAILAHGGEAAAARARFRSLLPEAHRALLEFLRTL